MNTANKPIGIFDSGAGGLTVVNAVRKLLPNESLIYAGDTARVPYGGQEPHVLQEYGRQIIRFLQAQDVKAVIVACGTISSNVMAPLRQAFDLPIFDVVAPGAEACLRRAENRRVGVLATAATAKSGTFPKILKAARPEMEVYVRACPLFVPLTEADMAEHPLAVRIARAYVEDWAALNLDALILGCTHYPLLAQALEKVLPGPRLIDMGAAAARTVRDYLAAHSLLNESSQAPMHRFFTSGEAVRFADMCHRITGLEAEVVRVHF